MIHIPLKTFPLTCECYPHVNKMCLLRDGKWVGLVHDNIEPANPYGVRDINHPMDAIIIDIQRGSLSFQDLKTIEIEWNKMKNS